MLFFHRNNTVHRKIGLAVMRVPDLRSCTVERIEAVPRPYLVITHVGVLDTRYIWVIF